ncbi:type III polyketide synthase [Mangrovibacillus cuniculi]|uniref:Type III polyketide synthase n=1 Tax=Mangrovibacillus cuniculi TaxID=2593652 RepID=A0A7S8CAY6_9BACI|nr:3-oxoacyl-[acyl-carrier-protein] synthase III C-terminal domain-containing protein [Mangrovibacillus cuniculi]QPC46649.1 type III polyketide synthase [Mangrovibacillus cuniculi]
MGFIQAVGIAELPYKISQEESKKFAKELFSDSFDDIERLLSVFQNGEIKSRAISMPMEWYGEDHSLSEKNDLYIKKSVEFLKKSIEKCFQKAEVCGVNVDLTDIDAIFMISTTGFATPSLDAHIMNELPFSPTTKRIPIWGLGCAGGAAGLARAREYCLAFPEAAVLVCSVELCSLTFMKNDTSKSNFIGSSLFSDGAATVLMTGRENKKRTKNPVPFVLESQSNLMPNSMDVMGWKIGDEGLHVIFSRDIPSIIKKWLRPNIEELLHKKQWNFSEIDTLIAHPGGKKVMDAYRESLDVEESLLHSSQKILSNYGNMSSCTILYVLEDIMEQKYGEGTKGIAAALGPGFSSELSLVEWCK